LPSINATLTPHPPGHIPQMLVTDSFVISIPHAGEVLIDGFVRSRKTRFSVIPAKAGIQFLKLL
jgi:hypothetical protein